MADGLATGEWGSWLATADQEDERQGGYEESHHHGLPISAQKSDGTTSPLARVPSAWKIRPSGVKLPSRLSLGTLRRKRTDPSAKTKFDPPTCRLEKSSRPPSVSVFVLFR